MARAPKTRPPLLTDNHAAILYALYIYVVEHAIPPTREELLETINETYKTIHLSEENLEKLLLELIHWRWPILTVNSDYFRRHRRGQIPNIYTPAPTLLFDPYAASIALHVHFWSQQNPHPYSVASLLQYLSSIWEPWKPTISHVHYHMTVAINSGYITDAPLSKNVSPPPYYALWPLPLKHARKHTKIEMEINYLKMLAMIVTIYTNLDGGYEIIDPQLLVSLRPELLINP